MSGRAMTVSDELDPVLDSSHIIVAESASLIDVAIAQKGKNLYAVCPDCLRVLGWSFEKGPNPNTWSCLHGCNRVFDNPLMTGTYSVLNLGHYQSQVQRWVAGWLGLERMGSIEIRIEE